MCLTAWVLIVQLCDFGSDGDAQYRLHEPSRQLGALPGVSVVDCHFAAHGVAELAEAADVLVIQFFNDWELLSLCERRRRAGKVTVFEANDYFFDLPSWSPIGEHWRDRTVQELYTRLLVTADGVQTSSQSLADHWRKRGARTVAVFANQLADLNPLPPSPARPFTIGWGGSPGHFADWFSVAPLLAGWLADRPDVHLAVMTNELARDFFGLPVERYDFCEFGSLAHYLGFLRRLDVGIAPLLPTEYNRGRSDVKFLEYASQGVAGIYADLDPYRGVIEPGRTGLLYRTPAELIEALDRLYTDPDLRQRIRGQAYDYVATSRMIGDHVGDRLTWYRELGAIRRQVITAQGAAAQGAANQQGRESGGGYRQVRLGEPELALQHGVANPDASASATVFAELLAQDPDYVALLQSEGKRRNDRGEPSAALDVLTRACALSPNSSRTLIELARTHFLLGDKTLARQTLTGVLRSDRTYLPGWQYLLRLNVLTNSPDAATWADEAITLFPTCYPVVLLAIGSYEPAVAVLALRELLDRVEPTLTLLERPVALTAFRETILVVLNAVAAGPEEADTIELLRRACEVFGESARLAGEYGDALYRAGVPDLAHAQLARAASLRSQAAVDREEFGTDAQIPWTWVFAQHIQSVTGSAP